MAPGGKNARKAEASSQIIPIHSQSSKEGMLFGALCSAVKDLCEQADGDDDILLQAQDLLREKGGQSNLSPSILTVASVTHFFFFFFFAPCTGVCKQVDR